MITILAPVFIIGGMFISDMIHYKYVYVVILIVLIPYFLINTGIMYQIFGNHQEIMLNSTGIQYDMYYYHGQELNAANWLDNNRMLNTPIYSDLVGSDRLFSATNIPTISISDIFNYLNGRNPLDGYLYFGFSAAVNGNLIKNNNVTNISAEVSMNTYSSKIATNNKIYSNGGTNIWFYQ